mmetsp:Transcript_12371/g.18690  ORF Transcript_12371/g.18690 Transcript_12371/m.18690 type:complete len:253 (+) Transcript_12371:155-913(+)
MANQPSQWEKTECLLLKHQTFFQHGERITSDILSTQSSGSRSEEQSDVGWSRFFNTLQARLERICRSFNRPLANNERNYLHQQMQTLTSNQQRPMRITKTHIEKFWDWFGAGFKLLRDPRKNRPMWLNGLVCAFQSRQSSEMVLTGKPPGTILIRLSTGQKGRLCLAFVKQDRTIGHYMLSPEANSKKLADFFIPFSPESKVVCSRVNPTNGEEAFSLYSMQDIVDHFASKKKVQKGAPVKFGYPDQLMELW